MLFSGANFAAFRPFYRILCFRSFAFREKSIGILSTPNESLSAHAAATPAAAVTLNHLSLASNDIFIHALLVCPLVSSRLVRSK